MMKESEKAAKGLPRGKAGEPRLEREKSAFWQAVGFAFKFGYTITIPLVALALAGRFLDKKFYYTPIVSLTGIVLSLIISSIMLLMKVKKVMEEIK